MIDHYMRDKVMNMARATSEKTGEEITAAYMETMKNVTRAAIFAQLYRKPELTATEISKILGEDVDVVYYHMKLLRKMGLVTEPRVEVRGNYIEKYYSLTAEAKQSLFGEERRTLERKALDKMDPEEFRQVLMTAFALVQSLTAGAISQIKQVDRDVIADLKEKRSVSIQIIGCTEDRYSELLEDLKEIARVSESANHRELGYMIVFWALPKLDAD
jgi:DNA-binding transcriptional ArsR family regulator